jgi:hypothetical protein
MSSWYTTIIVADSRGRGLDDFIGSHPTPINYAYAIEVLPGKSIPDLIPTIESTITRYNSGPYYCVIFAGICGLTVRTRTKNTRILRYPEDQREARVNATSNAIYSLKHKFNTHINFCTIVPASLQAYFKAFNADQAIPDFLQEEQLILEDDISKINSIIVAINGSDNLNINVISRFQIKSKKKRQRSGKKVVYRRVTKFTSKDLVDGVHFTPDIKAACFGLIVDTSIRDFEHLTNPVAGPHRQQSWPVGVQQQVGRQLPSADQQPEIDSPDEEQAPQDRSWDFKGHGRSGAPLQLSTNQS